MTSSKIFFVEISMLPYLCEAENPNDPPHPKMVIFIEDDYLCFVKQFKKIIVCNFFKSFKLNYKN